MKKALAILVFVLSLGSIRARAASSCTISITGGAGVVNGPYSCSPKLVYDPTQHALVFALTLSTPASGYILQLTVAVEAPQVAARAGTFAPGAGGTTGGATLKEIAGPTKPVWIALASTTSTLIGQSTLILTDLGPVTTAAGKQSYLNPKGTLSATMEPESDSGASGSVALELSF